MRTCQVCGKEFERPKDYSQKQWEARKHCSNACKSQARLGKPWHLAGLRDLAKKGCPKPEGMVKKGKESPNWNGGIYLTKEGRWQQTKSQGNKMCARLVAGKIIGRDIKSDERIHHINGIKSDDKPDNLYLFRHMSAHMRWHLFLRRHNLHGLLESNLIGQNI
jgi:hypothetical protein